MTLFGPQMSKIAEIIKALDSIADDEDEFTPYVQFIPVYIGDEVYGYLTDEIGGAYQYWEASPQWREWWARKPK